MTYPMNKMKSPKAIRALNQPNQAGNIAFRSETTAVAAMNTAMSDIRGMQTYTAIQADARVGGALAAAMGKDIEEIMANPVLKDAHDYQKAMNAAKNAKGSK